MGTDTHQPQSRWLRWTSWALWALVLAGLAYLAGLTIWLGVVGLFFPYQLDYGEGVMLHFVEQWSQGHPIYRAGEGYPYITSNYAPLAMLLALALTPVLGISYTAGRFWTLLAALAAATLIAAWVRRESGRWLPACATALLFLASPYIYHWVPLFRVDLVGLALTLGGLYAVYVAYPRPASGIEDRGVRPLLWLAVVLLVAALYTKQSFVFAPAAALIYLFFFVNRATAAKMALAMTALGGGLFLLINALTGGGFWYGLVASNVNPFLWPEFWQQQAGFFGTFAVLLLLSAWYLADKFLVDRSAPLGHKVSPLDLYLPAALSSVLLAGKAGAWENYFFEALAALVLCSGLGLARLARHGRMLYGLAAPLLLLVQLGLMWHSPQVADRYLRLTRQSNEEMIPILAQTPDPIISEDMGLLVTNGKELDYYSFQNSQLARAERWDQSWELGQLRGRNLAMVILETGTRLDVDRYQRFTREFLSELDRNYRHSQRVGKYELYVPDPLQREGRVEFGEGLALVGWSLDAPHDLEPGDTISLTVVWQAQEPPSTSYTAFAHLVDKEGQGWAGDDHQPYDGAYPTSAWGSGEMVRDTFILPVPEDAPPGLYDVEVGWYEAASQERLPVGQETAFRLAVLPVGWEQPGTSALEPLGVRFGESVTLEGFDWQVGPRAVHLTLRWSTQDYLDKDYTVFIHLVDPRTGGQLQAQADAAPMEGRWPTSLWLPGVPLDDKHTIPLPEELAPGSYEVLVGLYDPETGARLHLPEGSDALRLTGLNLP